MASKCQLATAGEIIAKSLRNVICDFLLAQLAASQPASLSVCLCVCLSILLLLLLLLLYLVAAFGGAV